MDVLLQRLPTEIVDEIFTMLESLYHREKMAIVMKEYSKKRLPIVISSIDNYVGKIPPFTMIEHTEPYVCNYMVETVNECNCCTRHQERRPTLEMYLEGFVPEYPLSGYQSGKCQCPCRHLARTICREMNDYEWVD